MRRVGLLLISVLTICFAFAQNQNGVVKTRGRMINGKHIPGNGLPGAVVSIKGRTAVGVKNNDGSFSFPVTGNQYVVESVNKNGYALVDADAAPKAYTQSPGPVYFVMETPDQITQDKLTSERRIRRTLQRQLQEREDEIEALKAENKISQQKYQEELQKLYADQESNEKLISEMAKRYSELDYDQIEEFYRQVNNYIEQGKLTKADSLLRSRGDVKTQVATQLQKGEALQQETDKLQKAKIVYKRDNEELANRCYSYYESFKMQHQNDSAAYYIELRAKLDTTNIEWKLCAIDFIKNIIADYDKAIMFSQEALNTASIIYGDSSMLVARVYNMLGCILADKKKYSQAVEKIEKSMSIIKHIYGTNHLEMADCWHNLGNLYSNMGEYEKALEFYNKALDMVVAKSEFDYKKDVVHIYNGIGTCYGAMGYNDKSIEFMKKALELTKEVRGTHDVEVGKIIHNMAIIYGELKKYDESLQYNLEAISIFKGLLGDSHPIIATCYMNIGNTYKDIDSLDLSEDFYIKALKIYRKYLGENIDVAMVYGNMANLYTKKKRYNQSIEYNKRALVILEDKLGGMHPVVAMIYTNIGTTYFNMGNFVEALEYANISLKKLKEIFGDGHPYVEQVLRNIKEVEDKIIDN